MKSALEGELVRLRAREAEDEPFAHRWANDAEVIRWLGARYPAARALSAERIRDAAPRRELCVFSIDDIATQHTIGWLGLHGEAVEHRSASLGIALGEKAYWNGGYGTDAMRGACRFGFAMMNLNRILDVYPENEGAIRCYEKAGFVLEARMRDGMFKHGSYHDLIQMSLLTGELK